MAEQFEIAPCDHGEAVADKIPGGVAQRRGLPGIVGNTGGAEDCISDFSIGCMVHATIGGAQHQLQAAALLLGQAYVDWHRQVVEASPQPVDRRNAVKAVGVERHYRRERLADLR